MTNLMSKPKDATILVVEDEPRLVHLIRTILGTAPYQVMVAATGEEAIEQMALESPDLIVLDLLLPGAVDGYEACRRIRSFSTVPIIMLTARAREEDKLRGFAAGADDYVTKPFSAKELLARVHAVLRRSQVPPNSPAQIEVGDLAIDLARRRITVAGTDVHLTPTEYRLLLTLARNVDKVIPHTTLLAEVWGPEYRDEIDYLRTYIRYLRRKIEPDPTNPRYLKTHPGVGYMLVTSES